jgi:phage terminase large subunit-like protein
MPRRKPAPVDDANPGEMALARVLRFFNRCVCQVDGPGKGKPFSPLPWQMDHIFRPVFGAVDPDGFRVVRYVHLDIAKKNGKSGLASGLAHYMAWGDGEPSARVAICAADKYQGRVIFDDCRRMVELNPILSKICTTYKNLILGPNDSSIEVLSADVKSKHGPKFSAVIMDEIHSFPGYGRDMYDVLAPSVVNRENPLVLTLTTAGQNTVHFWHELRERSLAKMANPSTDPAFHGVVFAADPSDDIFDETTWKKANPSYGTILNKRYFRDLAERARADKRAERLFRWLHLNQIVADSVSWIPPELLQNCRWSAELAGVVDDD